MSNHDATHDVYVAAPWREIERAKEAAAALRDVGYRVWCFWEQGRGPLDGALEAHETLPAGHPLRGKTLGALNFARMDDLLAVRYALCLVLVEPAGNDAYYEAGFALGRDVPMVRYGRPERRGLMTFDAPVAETPAELADLVAVWLGRPTALVRVGQGDSRREWPATPRDGHPWASDGPGPEGCQ